METWEQDETPELRSSAEQRGQLRFTYDTLIHHANLLVHGSAHGLVLGTERITVGDKSLVYVTEGPDQEYLRDAMMPSYWCYDRVLRLMLAERSAPTEQLDEQWAAALDGWASVPGTEAKSTGRNSPCPCSRQRDDGSALKFKNFHGRPALDAEQLQTAFHARALAPFPPPRV